MARLAIQDRPDRRVQPGMARQRPVVKVHPAVAGQCQNGLGHHHQIGHRQDPIHRQPRQPPGQPGILTLHPKALLHPPVANGSILRHDATYGMPAGQPLRSALDGQTFIADQDGGQGHVRLPPAIPPGVVWVRA